MNRARDVVELDRSAPDASDPPARFGFRSAHIYGGLLLLLIGGEALAFGLGFGVVGAALLYLGVWRL